MGTVSCQSVPERERKPFFLYIDEVPFLHHPGVCSNAFGVAKVRHWVVLSHQHFAQLDVDLRETIFGNAGTILAFRVGGTNPTLLTKQFTAYFPLPRDPIKLRNYEMFVWLLIDGVQSKPLSTCSLPPNLM